MSAPFIERVPRAAGDAIVDTVLSQKGGAGKTTITVNVAAVIGENTPPVPDAEDAPVVAASIDPQRSLEKWAARVEEDRLPFDYVSTRGNIDILRQLKKDPGVRRIIVDTPGFMDVDPAAERSRDPLGRGNAADALRELLAMTDRALVPINPEHLSLDPAEYTIERVLRPLGISFIVVINKYDLRDDPNKDRPLLAKTIRWITDRGYPYAPQPIRRFRLHADAAEKGLVCTRYQSSGTALRGREDFQNLALALNEVPL